MNPKITMGSTKWVTVKRFISTPTSHATSDCMATLKKKGYKIVATSPHHKTTTPDSISINQPLAIFFGNEKEGLSDHILQHADEYIYLPNVRFYRKSQHLHICSDDHEDIV